MSALSVRLPDSLHDQVRALAKSDGISINQFVASAVAEKMSALLTEKYLQERAARGSKSAFLNALEKVSDAEPEGQDKL